VATLTVLAKGFVSADLEIGVSSRF